MKLTLRLSTLVLLLALASALTWLLGRPSREDLRPASYPGQSAAVVASPLPDGPLSQDESENIEIYRRVSPGVVNITTTTLGFDFFFSAVPQQGSGSGSVIDAQGHILTNYHVIEEARRLEVTLLTEERKFEAKVIGADPPNDLAIIKIDPADAPLTVVPLGTSADLRVGQKALAIGNPFGLQGTLTVGVISSLQRSIQDQRGRLIDDVIQTDAAINPGNSGGPLLNARGELIGINTQIFSTSGGSIGIGFAVPVDTARRIVPDLISTGRVRRPFARLEGYGITPRLARVLDLPVTQGVLVARTAKGDSFSEAGIRGGRRTYRVGNRRLILGGDIIVEADGQTVDSIARLRRIVGKRRPGEAIDLRIYRDGQPMTLAVPLLERPRYL